MRHPYHTSNWGSVTEMFNEAMGAIDRTVQVTYTGTMGDLAYGHYRLSPGDDNLGDRLVCHSVTDAPRAVRDYFFTIGLDCDGSGTLTEADFIQTTPCNPANDCNCNGVKDSCELSLDAAHVDRNSNGILDACEIATNCPCNFNGDTVLNSQDFFDFLTCFLGGTCPSGRTSDYNMDGLTNSQDFFDFLVCFFQGGCV